MLAQFDVENDRDQVFEHYDTYIHKGKGAPFEGFLVPEDIYEHYRIETERAKLLDLKIVEMEALAKDVPTSPLSEKFIFLGFGGIIGALVAVSVGALR